VLVAYERDLTRRAQALVLEALADERLMVTAALSLAMACTELGGETRELAWLISDRDGPLSVLPLALGAMEIGTTASSAKTDCSTWPVTTSSAAPRWPPRRSPESWPYCSRPIPLPRPPKSKTP